MKRLIHLLLFAAWIVGAVTGGLTVKPDPPTATAEVRVVAETDWMRLTVQADQIVMTVGRGEDRWRAAASLPAFVHEWLRDVAGDAREDGRAPLLENATFIPLSSDCFAIP